MPCSAGGLRSFLPKHENLQTHSIPILTVALLDEFAWFREQVVQRGRPGAAGPQGDVVLFGAVTKGSPVSWAISAATSFKKLEKVRQTPCRESQAVVPRPLDASHTFTVLS
jgi:hypothetical protein